MLCWSSWLHCRPLCVKIATSSCRVAVVWHGLPLFAAPLQGLFVTVRTMMYFRCVLFVVYEGVEASQGGRAVSSVDCVTAAVWHLLAVSPPSVFCDHPMKLS